MSDDDVLLSAWYELMSDGSFAATFFGFDIVARSREQRRTVTFIVGDFGPEPIILPPGTIVRRIPLNDEGDQ